MVTNLGDLTPDQLLDTMLGEWWAEEAWARSLGHASAAAYQTVAAESFAASWESTEWVDG
jgi:hypothetical protein